MQWLTAGVFSVGPLISGRLTRWNAPPIRSLCCKYTRALMHLILVSMVSVSSRDKLIKYWVFWYFYVLCILIQTRVLCSSSYILLISKTVGNEVKENHSATKPSALHCCFQRALCSPPRHSQCLSNRALQAVEELYVRGSLACFCASVCVWFLLKSHLFWTNKDIIIKRLMNASFVNVMITGNVQYALRVLELMNMVWAWGVHSQQEEFQWGLIMANHSSSCHRL